MPISKKRGVNGAPIDPATAAMGDAYLGSRGKHAQPLPDPPRKEAAQFHCLGCGWGGPRAARHQRDGGRTCLCPRCGRLARREEKLADPPAKAPRDDGGRLESIAQVLRACVLESHSLEHCRQVVRFVLDAAAEKGASPLGPQLRRDLDELHLLRALRDSLAVQRECPVCRQTITLRFFRGVPDLLDVEGIPRVSRLSLRGPCPSCGQIDVRPSVEELRAVHLVAIPLPVEDDPNRALVEPFLGPASRAGRPISGRPARRERRR